MSREQFIPRINANDKQVKIAHLYVANGDHVEVGQSIVDLGTSKATVCVHSEFSGYIQWHLQKGDKVAVGAKLASFFSSQQEVSSEPAFSQTNSPTKTLDKTFSFVRFSKEADDLIKSKNIDRAVFNGRGLVTADHVRSYLQGSVSPQRASFTINTSVPLNPSLKRTGLDARKQFEIESLTLGASGMINSSLTVQFEAQDIYKILKTHQRFNGSLLPLLIYEVAQLLKQNPNFTSYYENGDMVHYGEVHLGLAMDLDNGLKVVTLKNTADLMPQQIYEQVLDFALRDMRGELSSEDVTGSTFTVTDLSRQNILYVQPLINGAQAAILAIGGDANLPGHPMTLTLTFDHRVLSGREVGLFLNTLKRNILQLGASLAKEIS